MLDWLELLHFHEVKKGMHVRGGVSLCPDGIVGKIFIDNSASREQVEVVNECLGRKSVPWKEIIAQGAGDIAAKGAEAAPTAV